MTCKGRFGAIRLNSTISRNGDRRGIIFYAAAIRYTYVTSIFLLTPGCSAEGIQTNCDTLSEFILTLIQSDFSRRLAVAMAKKQ